MNAPIVVAQASSSGSTTGTGSVRTIKVTKPANEHAVTIQLGYDQAYKLDLSSISNEKITLVHIGEKLIILFENKSTVTVEPFFDSMNAPLPNVTVEANGRDFTGSEFASSFPITTDQSVLTAAGVSTAGAPSSGADFHGPSVDPLNEPKPLDLLGQEELGNWTTTPQLGPTGNVTDTTPPIAAAAHFAADEKGLPGQEGEGGSSNVGSGEIADGKAFNNSDPSETTEGALSFSDTDGTAHVSLVNGTPVNTNGTVIVGAHGVLVINLDGTFTYTLTGNDLNHHSQGTGSDGEADVFTYTVEDSSGNTQTSTLTIDILDDVPTARPDTDSMGAGQNVVDGNVINGFGTNEGFNGAGHDTQGADGATVTGVVSGTNSTPVTDGSGLGGIAGNFGTLTLFASGSYEYVRAAGSPGGSSDVFTYTLTDGDGDTSVTTLTIQLGDNAPTLHVPSLQEPGTQVSEAGLPARGGEPEGSAAASNSEITSGTINFNSLDGVSSVEIDGVAVTPGSLPQTIVSDATGTLVITSYSFDAGTGVGSINYTYTLTDNTLTDPSSVSFGVTVTDADGDAAGDTLTINIVDDAPQAVNDTDTLSNASHTATGNVITAVDTTNAGQDTQGADGAVVSSILSDNLASGSTGVGAGGATINGQFGTLTIAEDGSYTYARTGTGALMATDTFTYTLTDGDGDTSTATLTINIDDSNVTITNLTPAALGGDTVVNEANLLNGSAPNAPALTQTGTFNISTPDGLDDLTVDGHAVITNGSFATTSFTTGLGNTLAIIGFDSNTGLVTYTYTLVHSDTHAAIQGTNDLFENFAVTVTDIDGSTASDTLAVRIIDDVPAAHNDVDTVNVGTTLVADGNVLTGIGGSDANGTDGVADTMGADGLLTWTGAFGGSITGLYGTVSATPDGTYTYVVDSTNAAVQALTNGQTLTESFNYTITDADGDVSGASLTITINGGNHGVTITNLTPQAQGGDVSVNEDDLLASRGVGESAGSDTSKESTTQVGTFNISTPDGLDDLTVGGHAVILNGVFLAPSFTTGLGNTLSFTGFNLATGVVTYSYTLNDNETHTAGAGTNSLFENFTVVLTDTDGSTASDTLSVNIVDDVPTARNDADSVKEDGPLVADGNVITGTGGSDSNSTDGVADTAGADGITSIAWTNQSGNTVAGAHGTLTVTGLGNYSYSLNNSDPAVQHLSNGQTMTETFNYTITDADGDTSPASLTITINGTDDGVTITNLTPQAQGGDVSVNEDDLLASRGVGESAGSDTTKESTTQTGTFNISAPDGVDSLTIGGQAVITGGNFAATSFTTGLGNTLAVTGYNAATGQITYSYTLNDNEAHAAGNGTNSLFENFAVQLKDLDGSTANDTLSVNIIDDVPSANAVTKSLTPAGHDTNVLLILDTSGSMGDASGIPGLSRLQAMKAAVSDLLDQYGDVGDVRVQIVQFNSDGAQVGSNWMTIAQAEAAVNALTSGGNTDYDAAVATVLGIYGNAGKLATAGVQNVSYFMSDGVPNESNGTGTNGIVGGEITAWQTFLSNNSINGFSLGMGAGSKLWGTGTLDPLAYNGVTHTDANATIVTDMSQLSSVLVGTVSGAANGNILTDGILPGSFGADGGHIQSITVDGTTYTYDPANGGSIAVSGGVNHGSFNTTTNTETVTLNSGGVLTMIMDDGTYSYTAPANVTSGFTDTVPFVLVDNDGDTSGNTLSVTVTAPNHAPVITSNGGGDTASISLSENSTAVTTVTSTDTDGPTAIYSIVGGADAAKFNINASTGVLTFISAPNFEAPTDVGANNVYNVTVQASDGSLIDTQAIAVTVTNVNEFAPVVTSNGGGATAAVNVAENTTVVTTVVATDADLTTPTYSILGGADAAQFSINASTGVLTFVAPHNFEAPTDAGANNVYDVTVRATDGTNFDDQAIAVTVTNVNEAPTAADDVLISNFGGNTYSVPEWAFLSNDSDPEGNAIDVNATPSQSNLSSIGHAAGVGTNGTIDIDDNGNGGNASFTYNDTDGSLISGNATVSVTNQNGGDLTGTAANEILFGDNNSNTFNGAGGNDIIFAGGGNDTVIGGTGSDTLTGGSGADHFRYTSTSDGGTVANQAGADHILDFSTAQGDVIEISKAAFSGLPGIGSNATGIFSSSSSDTFASGTERFHFNTTTGTLLYDSNGNAAGGTQIAIAVLENGGTVDAAHILMVA